jgi:hypothetical protein
MPFALARVSVERRGRSPARSSLGATPRSCPHVDAAAGAEYQRRMRVHVACTSPLNDEWAHRRRSSGTREGGNRSRRRPRGAMRRSSVQRCGTSAAPSQRECARVRVPPAAPLIASWFECARRCARRCAAVCARPTGRAPHPRALTHRRVQVSRARLECAHACRVREDAYDRAYCTSRMHAHSHGRGVSRTAVCRHRSARLPHLLCSPPVTLPYICTRSQ